MQITSVYHALRTNSQQRIKQHIDSLKLLISTTDQLRSVDIVFLYCWVESSELQDNNKNHLSLSEKLFDSVSLILRDTLRSVIIDINAYK